MAITTRTQDVSRHESTRVCCEFDWQSRRFEIVELDDLALGDGSGMFRAESVDLSDGIARFSIDGRQFAVRPKHGALFAGARAVRTPGPVPAGRLADLLTSREMQIVELVSTGLRNKQIASRLQLSEYTVAAYVKQICHKLQVSNRTAMVSRWFQAGVPTAPSGPQVLA